LTIGESGFHAALRIMGRGHTGDAGGTDGHLGALGDASVLPLAW
jgi:hypothetical protein